LSYQGTALREGLEPPTPPQTTGRSASAEAIELPENRSYVFSCRALQRGFEPLAPPQTTGRSTKPPEEGIELPEITVTLSRCRSRYQLSVPAVRTGLDHPGLTSPQMRGNLAGCSLVQRPVWVIPADAGPSCLVPHSVAVGSDRSTTTG